MNIIRYSRPQHDVFGRRFSDIMDEFFNDAISTRTTSFIPSMDVSETDKEVKVEVTLPGLQKNDIHLELENSQLTVSESEKWNVKTMTGVIISPKQTTVRFTDPFSFLIMWIKSPSKLSFKMAYFTSP